MKKKCARKRARRICCTASLHPYDVRRVRRHKPLQRLFGILVLTAALVFARADAHADTDPAFITFGAGWFDVNKRDDQAGEFRLEYWSNTKWWVFKPFAGVMALTRLSKPSIPGVSPTKSCSS